MAKILIPVRLDPDIAAKLDEIVVRGVGDRSDHLRQAVSEYIARHNGTLSFQESPLALPVVKQ
jgi:metal-responsive CopG/Arc/MetJ family transcriptional regulator